MLRKGIRYLFFGLGLFEMVMVYRMLFEQGPKLRQEVGFYPDEYFQQPNKNLLVAFTFFLGLIRVVWSLGDNKFGAWLAITLSHIGECIFLWSCALLPHYNRSKLPLAEFAQNVFQMKVGQPNNAAILIIVLVLAGLLVLHGPGGAKSGDRKAKSS